MNRNVILSTKFALVYLLTSFLQLWSLEMVCIHKSYIVYFEISVMPIVHGFSFFWSWKVMEKSWKMNVGKEGVANGVCVLSGSKSSSWLLCIQGVWSWLLCIQGVWSCDVEFPADWTVFGELCLAWNNFGEILEVVPNDAVLNDACVCVCVCARECGCEKDVFFYSLVYDNQQKSLIADHGEIRVGLRYQVEIIPDKLESGTYIHVRASYLYFSSWIHRTTAAHRKQLVDNRGLLCLGGVLTGYLSFSALTLLGVRPVKKVWFHSESY